MVSALNVECTFGGFIKKGGTPLSLDGLQGKIPSMDDDWGYPYDWKPPHVQGLIYRVPLLIFDGSTGSTNAFSPRAGETGCCGEEFALCLPAGA